MMISDQNDSDGATASDDFDEITGHIDGIETTQVESTQESSQRKRDKKKMKNQVDAARRNAKKKSESGTEKEGQLKAAAAKKRTARSQETRKENSIRKRRNAQSTAHQRREEAENEKIERRRLDSRRAHVRRSLETEESKDDRREKDAERTSSRRSEEPQDKCDERRKKNAERTASRRSEEPEEKCDQRRKKNAERTASRRSEEPQEKRDDRRKKDAERQSSRRSKEPEDKCDERRKKNAERTASRRSEEPEDKCDERRKKNAERTASRRSEEPEEKCDERRKKNAERTASRRSEEPEEVRQKRQRLNKSTTASARADEPPEKADARKKADKIRKSTKKSALLGIAASDDRPNQHYCGKMEEECDYCGALFFEGERTATGLYSKCCSRGLYKLPAFDDFPKEIKDLFTGTGAEEKNFRENIRQYNNSVAMGSMKAELDVPRGRGPYCYRLHGQIYHFVGPLHPEEGEPHQFSQVFIMDTAQAASELAGRSMNSSCKQEIFEKLINCLKRVNPFVGAYKTMLEVEKEEEKAAADEDREQRNVKMIFRINSSDDHRIYQNSTATEVGAVFVGDDFNIPGQMCVTVHQRRSSGSGLTAVPNYDPTCMALVYPLLFPTGMFGWHPKMMLAVPRGARKRISMRQFYLYYIHQRKDFSPLFLSSKLFQQFLVDSWVKVEQDSLNWIRQNQEQLRVEPLNGLQDYVNGEETGAVGTRILLPSSVQGSPRHMVQQYQDAMAIVSRKGRPDYFITMTANPKWPEIQETLKEGQTASDRPDIVSRVFQMKLEELVKDLFTRKVLGEPAGYIHVTELQKRGLPHVHMLIIMKPGSKPRRVTRSLSNYSIPIIFRTSAEIDKVVSAQLPDKNKDPELFGLVSSLMMHRPCGVHNPNSPCMRSKKDGTMKECDKNFPKDFTPHTVTDIDGFAKLRRLDDGNFVMYGDVKLTNQHVVPYNPWLLRKFNSHINVEPCGSVGCVKYLFKYVYKGSTRASIHVFTNKEGVEVRQIDEINQFLDTRYICAPESVLRLFGFEMKGRSTSVIHLAIHLPGQQGIVFKTGKEADALQSNTLRDTTLTAFFKLNQRSKDLQLPDGSFPDTALDSRSFYYHEIPEHFCLQGKEWKQRSNANSTIGRMYFVAPQDRERYALRQLLLYIKGPTSFDDLLTIDGNLHSTFMEAARAAGFLEDDSVNEQALEEASSFHSASQLRSFFATLLCFNTVNDAESLWYKFLDDFCEDFEHQNVDRSTAESMAYFDIFDRLDAMKKDLRTWINLPYQRVKDVDDIDIDFDLCERNGDDARSQLNPEQAIVVDSVLEAMDRGGGMFFIDGPGGSGKTFVYNCLANIVQGQRKKILCIAWTGIAASLLPGGRTVASIFKLDINSGCRLCKLNPRSSDAKKLANVDIIFWDEAPMSPKAALETVDQFFRDLTDVQEPFGGKVVVLGGDFRQVLPVMDKGGVDEQVANCIKKSNLWRHFRTFKLSSNMRLQDGDAQWRTELLAIGDGLRGAAITGEMKVPEELISSGDLAEEVFGDLLDGGDVEKLSKVAILTPRNKEALELNNEILDRMPGVERLYTSFDCFGQRDSTTHDDSQNFTTELLNGMTPSGMPPHRLKLKIGSIVMLLRNLDVKNALCNGTRFVVEEMGARVLKCKFVTGARQGQSVLIPRIKLDYEKGLPFVLSRLQFPIRLSFAMTINKSQGQTFEKIGLQLEEPIFSHGQLYVALSRTRSKGGIHVESSSGKMNNVVFKDVL